MSSYDDGYRDGAMAERKRAILVALQARLDLDQIDEVGHSVAHQISAAGDRLPVAHEEPWVVGYSAFGERRLSFEVPTFLERHQSPFTHAGKKKLRSLRRAIKLLRRVEANDGWTIESVQGRIDEMIALQERVEELQDDRDALLEKVADLEATIDDLVAQLGGKLG